MRFGARISKTPCQNRNPWVQGLARCFAYACTKSHPNRSKCGGDIAQIGAHQLLLSFINFVINSTPQGPWERKGQKTRVTPYLTRNSVRPVLVITDHANLQYYREPQKLGPQVNGYVAELTKYHIRLVYRPGAVNQADKLSRRPDLAPTDDNELVLVLPNHLFVSPDAPTMAYTTTRTKPEDYDSDETLVPSDNDELTLAIKAATPSKFSAEQLDRQVAFSQVSGAHSLQCWRTAHSLIKRDDLWTKDGASVVVGNNELHRGLIS